MKINYYSPANPLHWHGRETQIAGEYIYQKAICIDIENLPEDFDVSSTSKKIALIGFFCDAGVIRNQGRAGAKQGAVAIRKQLGKLAWHFDDLQLYDLGDIVCEGDALEEAQLALGQLVAFAQSRNMLPIVLGGGHETAWAHYQGIRSTYPKKNLHIINFDAHFDLRPLLPGNTGSSGTSFLQIAHHAKEHHLAFNYCVLGLQESANTQLLFDTAKQWNVSYVTAEDIFENSNLVSIEKFLQQSEGIYLTFCLDVMSAAIAPGVSAPQANGLMPEHIWPLLRFILQQNKLLSFDIVELAPNLDRDDQTAKLASWIVYEVILFFLEGVV